MNRNTRNRGDGLALLKSLRARSVACVVLDPQYRGQLDKMGYGNEGERQRARAELPQMSAAAIEAMLHQVEHVLRPSGHLFLWVDKHDLCEGLHVRHLHRVDMFVWEKPRMGMGYRGRRKGEYLLVFQKGPKTTKNWTDHGIPDVWTVEKELFECAKLQRRPVYGHPHAKPLGLQSRLIGAVTRKGQLVVDPCAGGYSVLEACRLTGREYLGCDVRG